MDMMSRYSPREVLRRAGEGMIVEAAGGYAARYGCRGTATVAGAGPCACPELALGLSNGRPRGAAPTPPQPIAAAVIGAAGLGDARANTELKAA
jgi:hypothetical protein